MGTSGLWLDILIIFLYQLHKCWQRTEKECNTLEYYCSIVVTLPPLYEYEYKHKTCSSSLQSSRGTLDIITIGHRGNLKTLSLNMTSIIPADHTWINVNLKWINLRKLTRLPDGLQLIWALCLNSFEVVKLNSFEILTCKL